MSSSVERHGPVAWLTVNRPEVRNALSLEITQRIAETLRELSRDRSLRVFVLTGAGDRVFVSGADVREFREQLATPESALRYDAVPKQLQSALREVPQPVIAMIQGMRSGAGRSLPHPAIFASRCAQRNSAYRSRNSGSLLPCRIFCDWCNSSGPAKAKWLLMTGQLIEAPEAQAIGLIDEVVEPAQLKSQVESLASILAANAPLTIKATKQIIETMTAPTATVVSGAPWYAEIFRSHDFKAGLDAFFNKRKPEFTGE